MCRLYHGTLGNNEAEKKIEKLKCILHYFERVRKIKGNGNILSFERRSLSFTEEPDWGYSSTRKMSYVNVFNNEGIESAKNCLQVDFANQFIGELCKCIDAHIYVPAYIIRIT